MDGDDMKFIRKNKIIIAICSFILIVLIFSCLKNFYFNHKVFTEINYCKEIAREYGWLKLKQFRCSGIDKWDDSTISFHFELKNIDKYNYNEDESIEDISKIKDMIKNYLEKHPSNELNNKKIEFAFETYPGDISYMYNYDFRSDMDEIVPSDFFYYEKIFTRNISSLKKFQDAKVMDVAVVNLDDYSFFYSWSDIEYFNIFSSNMTEQDKENLKNYIPNCRLICNDEPIES